jgi:ribosomal protein S18 acetylase RimI-like enzyme
LAKISTKFFSSKFGDIYYIDAHELIKEDDMLIISYKNAKLAAGINLEDSIFFSKIINKKVIDSNGEKIGRIIDAIIHIDYKVSFILGGSYFVEILEDLGVIPNLDIFLPTNTIINRTAKGDFQVKYEKQYFKKKASRLDMIHGIQFDRFPGEKHHVFYKMKTQLINFEKQMVMIAEKVESSSIAKGIIFTNLSYGDRDMFIELHDDIFLKSPDPVRMLTKAEVKLFDEESTFIAWYAKKPIGFIYLPIFVSMDGNIEGSIAGIGVRSQYRGKKVALTLIKHGFEFLKENKVEWVTSDVFEKNEPSRKMFESLGFEIFDHMVLENQNQKEEN